MEPIFRKCVIALNKIHDNSLPLLEVEYKKYISNIKKIVLECDSLNECRSIVNAAKEAYDSLIIDNKNVKKELYKLMDFDKVLIKESKDLNESLQTIESLYYKTLRNFADKNHDFLLKVKEGSLSAEYLLVEIIAFAKNIQMYTYEDIPSYEKEIASRVKKIEDKICDEVFSSYNNILRLDPQTLPKIIKEEWTYVEPRLFQRKGAFVQTDYITT